jgi:hypothetical protein
LPSLKSALERIFKIHVSRKKNYFYRYRQNKIEPEVTSSKETGNVEKLKQSDIISTSESHNDLLTFKNEAKVSRHLMYSAVRATFLSLQFIYRQLFIVF